MHRGITYAIAFITGAAAGAVVAWQVTKKKYEERTKQEVDSFIEYWTEKNKADKKEAKEAEKSQLQEDLAEYAYLVEEYTEGGSENMAKPVVIDPEEFGAIEDYEIISLVYYNDEVLVDSHDVPVDDIDDKVGADFAKYFGKYEDDAVHVRNDRLKHYYEILADEQNYADVANLTEDE
jgi:hypothetical protein